MNPAFWRGLGAFRKNRKTHLFLRSPEDGGIVDFADTKEGEFQPVGPVLIHPRRSAPPPGEMEWRDFRIAKIPTGYFMTYRASHPDTRAIHGAFSTDLSEWHELGTIVGIRETGAVVSQAIHKDRLVMYFGESSISLAFSADLHRWRVHPQPVLEPRPGKFDAGGLTVANVFLERRGILVVYYCRDSAGRYALGSALFDRHDPEELLWRSDEPIWQAPPAWQNKKISPLAVIESPEGLLTFWESAKDGIFSDLVIRRAPRGAAPGLPPPGPALVRFALNPIIGPRSNRKWESKQTFNPTAFVEDGVVHLIYRAIGDEDVSYLGYAMSRDGYRIDERLDQPIYVPTEPFEGARAGNRHGLHRSPGPFESGGGGWGGCEDPRVTKIGDMLYMTYVAYDGWSPPRVALTSITLKDFLARNWNWARPVLISEPNIVNKNACILPEKVNGKFVVFHRIYPDILVDYMDDLDFDGKTKWLRGDHHIRPKQDAWDSRKLGVGGTPIKTDEGWLLIYQGVGEQDPGRYKIGAMLLDLNEPHRVLHRAKEPILEPEEKYENHGHKWGVVYPCGAVVKDGELLVYYGGADSYTCVASAPVKQFVADLVSSESPKITRLPVSV